MSGTFNGAPSITTRGHGGKDDKQPAPLGGLTANAMTATNALGGTLGVDTKLIHGNRWQEIKGNQVENIQNSLQTHIVQNETWNVDGDIDITIGGETKDHRHGDVNEYYLSESKFEYFLEHTDQHHDEDHQINPTHTFDILHVEGEYKNIDLAIKALALEAKGMSVDLTGGKGEAWGAGAEAWGVQVSAGAFVNEACALDVQEKAAEHDLKLIKDDILGLQSQIGAARTIIMPVRVGICIAVHIDSPWA